MNIKKSRPPAVLDDCKAALKLAADLMEADSLEAFVQTLVKRLHAVMNAVATGYNETDVVARRFTFVIHPREMVNDDRVSAWVKNALDNPHVRHVQRHPEDMTVHMTTDFKSIEECRRKALWKTVYTPMKAEYQIGMPIQIEKTRAVAIVFNRNFNFTEADRRRLTVIQPVVISAYRHFLKLEDRQTAEAAEAAPAGWSSPAQAEPPALTPRLRQVMALMSEGRSNAQIARALKLSVRTIEKYVETILKKMSVRSRSEAIAKSLGGR
jgi:DNA-binding CsgD family transcriptional regulator